MPVASARLLRKSLNKIESYCDDVEITKIPIKHRFDQDPKSFITN
jgi:glutathione S-transferase